MLNNDILRRLRYILDINDLKMMEVFLLGGSTVSREQLSNSLKKDDEPGFTLCEDDMTISFLEGLIIDRRGPSSEPALARESIVSNNLVFRKLKIAFNMQADDIQGVFKLVGFSISNHELSAFFRRPSHKNYRECQDQILRNFLHGLQLKYRPSAA